MYWCDTCKNRQYIEAEKLQERKIWMDEKIRMNLQGNKSLLKI
jgi:hypothetical protein